MMDFFSRLLDYPFPWPKYDQIVVRNFVSGAMENTSASVFMEALQCREKELADKSWDYIIAHELFHQWFGDLVTLESWANLPLNESFANYAEYLWLEHFKGQDEADLSGYKEKQEYFTEALRKNEPLIRFHHNKPDDMFDSHSYAKGGRILHMLRREIGDDAFFESLRLYLKRHAYKTVEIHDLRLAMEEVSGRDLNWFFQQWFLRPGHPVINITSEYLENELVLRVQQNQDTSYFPVYRIHLPVEIHQQGKVQREVLNIRRGMEEFRIPVSGLPELILPDPDASILAELNFDRSAKEWQAQYRYAKRGMLRLQALYELSVLPDESAEKRKVFSSAIKDSFWLCREMAVDYFKQQDSTETVKLFPEFRKLAQSDPQPSVRKAALQLLSSDKNNDKKALLSSLLNDSSLSVSSEAYRQYFLENYPDASEKRKILEADSINDYRPVLSDFYASRSDDESFNWFKTKISEVGGSGIYDLIRSFGRYLNLEGNAKRRPDGFQLLYRTAMEGSRAEQVLGAYQVLKEMDDVPDARNRRKEIREKHRDDDFGSILEYLE
jgi:aminopeptidase N